MVFKILHNVPGGQPPPFNWKFCATPKICKKLCCNTKIVDFTAFLKKILAARATYAIFNNVMRQHMHFLDNVVKQHTHFFGIAPLFETLATALGIHFNKELASFGLFYLFISSTNLQSNSAQWSWLIFRCFPTNINCCWVRGD